MPIQFVKYNPAFLDEDALIRNFVVRQTDLDMIMEVIRENTTQSNQHVLVIGPRGSGKTTLALRVAAEIGRETELQNNWYPIVFSEESYRATSTADFWLEALSHLADQTGEGKWIRAFEELRLEPDDQRLGDRPLWQLLDFADSQNKKILLVVENLNMLFCELLSEDEAWKMRHTLINEPRLMLLATATTKFEDIEDPSRAMFEMFKIHELEPLNDEESNTIWELVTGSRLAGEQIRPVRILTGGNARLLAIIAKFGAHRSFRQLLEDLVSLIDDHTDYFKSRIDYMPSIERKVYLALAELWRPATAREIGSIARLDVNKTSALLNRLANRGDVLIESQNRKTRLYRIAEGIYNIYYLMRRRGKPADRVRAAIQFMVAMYGHESAGKILSEEACKLAPELCRDHYLAYEQLITEITDRSILDRIISVTPKSFLESPYLDEKVKTLIVISQELNPVEKNRYEDIVKILRQGGELFKAGNFQQALQLFENVVTASDNLDKTPFSVILATALNIKGITLEGLSKPEEAIAVYDEVLRRYGRREETELSQLVARALISKALTLGKLSKSEEALIVYNEVIQRYGHQKESELAQLVAIALVNMGVTHGKMPDLEKEIADYNEVIQRYSHRDERELAEQVAMAMINKGNSLRHLAKPEAALTVYDEMIKRYGHREEREIVQKVAMALVNKGVLFENLSRLEEAIAVYDEVIQRYGHWEERELVEKVAIALVNKGFSFDNLSRLEEAIAVYDEVIQRYGHREEIELSKQVAMALINKGIALGNLSRPKEAFGVYDETIQRYGHREERDLAEQVAIALVNKGVSLHHLAKPDAAIAVYDEVIQRYGSREEHELAKQVTMAMINKGVMLRHLTKPEEAIAVYDEVIQRYEHREETELTEGLARALVYKAIALRNLTKPEKAIAVYDEVIQRYGHREESEFAQLVAVALLDKGEILGELSRPERAVAVFDEVIQRYGNRKESQLAEQVARALNAGAWEIYLQRDLSMLPKAESQVRRALEIAPDEPYYHHTLACILCNQGKRDQALEFTKRYIQNTTAVQDTLEDAIELFIALAANGLAQPALALLEESPAKSVLEPLVVGLKRFLNEDIQTAPEISAVADDLVQRIEERISLLEMEKQGKE